MTTERRRRKHCATAVALSRERKTSAIRVFALLLISAGACLVTAACRRPPTAGAGVSADAHFDPMPVRTGMENVTIRLTDRSARPIAHAAVMIEADMSHPGMSPVFGEAFEKEPGTYIGKINFNMGGDWVVLMHIKLLDGKKLDRQVMVPGVRSN